MAEQGTHKPFVVGSTPTLATKRTGNSLRLRVKSIRKPFQIKEKGRFVMAKIIRNDKGTTSVPEISECVEAFILSRRTQNCTFQTIRFYQKKLPQIVAWLEAENITRFEEISPTDIRIYLDQLRESGHNKGGTHIFYRVLKAYLRWVWDEYDLTIRNPIDKIRCEAPR